MVSAYSLNSLNSLRQQKSIRRYCTKTLSRIDKPLIILFLKLFLKLNQADKIPSAMGKITTFYCKNKNLNWK